MQLLRRRWTALLILVGVALLIPLAGRLGKRRVLLRQQMSLYAYGQDRARLTVRLDKSLMGRQFRCWQQIVILEAYGFWLITTDNVGGRLDGW